MAAPWLYYLALLAALLAAACSSTEAAPWEAGDVFIPRRGSDDLFAINVFPAAGGIAKEIISLSPDSGGGCSEEPTIQFDSDITPQRMWYRCRNSAWIITKTASGTNRINQVELPGGGDPFGFAIGNTKVFSPDTSTGQLIAYDRADPLNVAPVVYDVPLANGVTPPSGFYVTVAPSGPGGSEELFIVLFEACCVLGAPNDRKFIWRFRLPASGTTLVEVPFNVAGFDAGNQAVNLATSTDGTTLLISGLGSLPTPQNCLTTVDIAGRALGSLCVPEGADVRSVASARGPDGAGDVWTRDGTTAGQLWRWAGSVEPAVTLAINLPLVRVQFFAVASYPPPFPPEPTCAVSNFIGPGTSAWWGPFRPRDGRVDYALEPVDWIDGCAEKVEKCQEWQANTNLPAADCLCPAWRCLNPVVRLEPGCEPVQEVKCRATRPALLRAYCSLINERAISCARYLSAEQQAKLDACIASLPQLSTASHKQLHA